MKRLLLWSFQVTVLASSGCDLGSDEPVIHSSIQPREIIIADNWQSVNLHIDPAVIKKAAVRGGRLLLTVEYGGGCNEHEFDLYAWRGFLESNPPQAEIKLSHNAYGDVCKALLSEDLVFDLSPLKLAYNRAYGNNGQLLLRIYEPGKSEPMQPLLLYSF